MTPIGTALRCLGNLQRQRPPDHSWPASLRGQDRLFRAAQSVVIVPTLVVMVPIPVMVPVVVPVVIGVLHSFAVAAALVPLGLHDGAAIELAEMPIPINAVAIVPNIIRRSRN
jgi:hypothetical protein